MIKRTSHKSVAVLLTASDYARRHVLTRAGVNYLVKNKKVRAVRIGGMWVIEDKLRIS